MASAFDVKSNCSRSSVGTQSLNNLSVQFPSTSFTLFVIGSALDFGAFLLGASARLVYGGVRFVDQRIRLLDPFLLASGEQKFIYIPGNILKEKKSREQATNQCLHFVMSCVGFGNGMTTFVHDAFNFRRDFDHFWAYLESVLHSTQQQGLVVTMNLLSWILTLRFNFVFHFLSLRCHGNVDSMLSSGYTFVRP